MWLLHFLPDSLLAFVVNAVLVLGILSTIVCFFIINRLLRWFPPFSKYVTVAQIVSLLILTTGVYFKGGHSTEIAWRERVREMEAQVAAAEAQSAAANEKLAQGSKEKIKVIREKGQIIKQYVDREITKYDNTCAIPQEVVRAHNAAAKNEAIK